MNMALDDVVSRRGFLKALALGAGLVLAEPMLVNGLEYLSGRAGAGQAIAENDKFSCENKICKLDGYWTVDDVKKYLEPFNGSTLIYWRHKDLGDNEMGDKFWNAMIEIYGKRINRFVRLDLDEYPEGKKIYDYVKLKELPNFYLIINNKIKLRIRGPPKKEIGVYKDIKENIEPKISEYI